MVSTLVRYGDLRMVSLGHLRRRGEVSAVGHDLQQKTLPDGAGNHPVRHAQEP